MSNTLITFANSICFPGANVSYDINETAFIDMGIFYKEITFANNVLANGVSGTPGDVLVSSGSGVYWTSNVSIENVVVGDNSSISSNTTTTSSTSQIEIDTFPISTYRSVKYLVQIVANNGDVHVTELLATHNGTTAYSVEYATIFSNISLGVIVTDILSGNFRLLLTPINSINNIKITRTSINN